MASLLLLGFGLRLHRLGLPIDRDSYDEGVYWQTLRALAHGESLYEPVFGSQPPMSQMSVIPIYRLFGSSLWSARFAGVLLSMVGVVAAFFIGRRLGGRLAGAAVLLLAVVDPLSVLQSRTLQAETPSLAFSFVAVAAALMWLDRPSGRRGRVLAVACGAALACSVLSKLTGAVTVAPVVAVMVHHLVSRRRDGQRPDLSLVLIPFGCLAAATIIVAPFLRQFDAMWTGVVTFHVDAADVFRTPDRPNGDMIGSTLASWLGAAALIGTLSAVIRRDGRVVMALAWLAASVAFLYQHTPVFDHHMVTLVPPLLALSAFGFQTPWRSLNRGHVAVVVLSTLVVVAATIGGVGAVTDRYRVEQEMADTYERTIYRAIDDLEALTGPEDLIVTDALFIAALADRDTPPNLVDVSDIRIRAGLLTADQMIEQTSAPEVRAVLFFPRLYERELRPFHDWMAVHFEMVRVYGVGRSLWLRR